MNYARLNYLQLDRVGEMRLSWGEFCYEIAQGGGACMHLPNAEHSRLSNGLRRLYGEPHLQEPALAVLRSLDGADEAEDHRIDLVSRVGAARVLSPVSVRAISGGLAPLDDRCIKQLLERIEHVPHPSIDGTNAVSNSVRFLVDFYRRAAARGQYLLLAEMTG